jgi:phospholipase C
VDDRDPAAAGCYRLAGPPAASGTALGRRRRLPIDHIVIDCRENRSFDGY